MQEQYDVATQRTVERDRPPRALVANEQEIWIWSLETILAPDGFTVVRATSAEQVFEQIEAYEPDILILHSTLRDASGLDLCREIREQQLVSSVTPIVVTTSGPCRRAERLEALRAGAWEYASLPIDAEELIARLRVYLSAKRSSDRACSEGLIDPVTGLYDLRGILTRLKELGFAARRHARPLGCAAISYLPASGTNSISHPGSDSDRRTARQSRSAPEMLRGVVRDSDILGRLAPNEFVVLAPETALAGVMQMGERVVAAFDMERGEPFAALPVRVGCYAVSDFASTHLDPMEMIVRATQALRKAQEPGARPVQPFTQELSV